jgi:hypothetical protein
MMDPNQAEIHGWISVSGVYNDLLQENLMDFHRLFFERDAWGTGDRSDPDIVVPENGTGRCGMIPFRVPADHVYP